MFSIFWLITACSFCAAIIIETFGHSLGATGVHEAIYTLIMMNNNFISGSANISDEDPEIGSIDIPKKTIKNIEINLALSNSFGFGGTNACLAFSKFN